MKDFNLHLLLVLVLLFGMAGCGSKLLTVYKIDIQQGNALEASKVDQIQLGMNKEQVQYVLGSPIIVDAFHPDRWDYIYLFTPGYGEQERRQLTLFFDRGEVIDIVRDNIVRDNLSTIDYEQLKKDEEKKPENPDSKSKEQAEAEEQAERLREALDKNKNPNQ